ncbi:hypothetical protein [Lysobacter gummosus]
MSTECRPADGRSMCRNPVAPDIDFNLAASPSQTDSHRRRVSRDTTLAL